MPAFFNKNYNTVHDAMNSSIRKIGVLQMNLDNVDTVGYKAINPDAVLFSETLKDMFRDQSQGELMNTGRNLDISLTAPNAFLLVEGEDGPERVRNGSFYLDNKGEIVNYEGKALVVLDRNIDDEIKLHHTSEIKINVKGEIVADGKYYGRLAIDYDHRAPGQVAHVAQGTLEASNAEINTTFMNMVQLKRHVDTLQGVMAMEMVLDKSIMETYGKNV